MEVRVRAEREAAFTLKLRIPAWVRDEVHLLVDGQAQAVDARPGGFASVRRSWKDDVVRLELPAGLRTSPIPDEPGTVAFMEGPVVLAGLCDRAPALHGDASRPEQMLAPDNEREFGAWRAQFRTLNEERAIRFIPLHEVTDEQFTVYFPVRVRG